MSESRRRLILVLHCLSRALPKLKVDESASLAIFGLTYRRTMSRPVTKAKTGDHTTLLSVAGNVKMFV